MLLLPKIIRSDNSYDSLYDIQKQMKKMQWLAAELIFLTAKLLSENHKKSVVHISPTPTKLSQCISSSGF